MFLIVGLILLLAGKAWFTGAVTVGWICIAVFIAEMLWYVFVLGVFAFGASRSSPSRSYRRRRF